MFGNEKAGNFLCYNFYGNRTARCENNLIIIACREKEIKWKITHQFEPHKNQKVERVDWSNVELGSLLATCSKREFAIWRENEDHWDCTSRVTTERDINEIKFSPHTQKLIIGFTDGKVKIFEPDNNGIWTVQQHFQSLPGSVYSINWNPLNPYMIVVAGNSNIINIWQYAPLVMRWHLASKLEGYEGDVNCVSWGDNNIIASASSDNTIKLWQIVIKETDDVLSFPLFSSQEHHQIVRWVQWDAFGTSFSSYGDDGRVLLWKERLFSSQKEGKRQWDCVLEYSIHNQQVKNRAVKLM